MSEIKRLEAELAEFEQQRQATIQKIAAAKREMACSLGETLLTMAEKDNRWKLIIGEIASKGMKKRKAEPFEMEMELFEESKPTNKSPDGSGVEAQRPAPF